jgi:hypothetical protein
MGSGELGDGVWPALMARLGLGQEEVDMDWQKGT